MNAPPVHIASDDLFLFALQFLPTHEMAAIQSHLSGCDACRNQLGLVQGDLAAYAHTAPQQAPPAQAFDRLMTAVAAEKRVAPVVARPAAPLPVAEPALGNLRTMRPVPTDLPEHEPAIFRRQSSLLQMEEREPRRGMGFFGWSGWAIAAGLAVAFGLQFQQHQALQRQLADATSHVSAAEAESARADAALQALTASGAEQVALHLPASAGSPAVVQPYGQAAYLPSTGALIFTASNLDPLAPARTYELWLLPADKNAAPIPAGTFKPNAHGYASVVLPKLPAGVQAAGFGVTVEHDGGTTKPTLPIVLLGT